MGLDLGELRPDASLLEPRHMRRLFEARFGAKDATQPWMFVPDGCFTFPHAWTWTPHQDEAELQPCLPGGRTDVVESLAYWFASLRPTAAGYRSLAGVWILYTSPCIIPRMPHGKPWCHGGKVAIIQSCS